MSRWWRAHASALDDPKVQRLPGETFKAWFNVLCLASLHDGILPALPDMAFALRKSEDATAKILETLKSAGLLDVTYDGLMPHNWNGRQFKSDSTGGGTGSTERVQRYRDKRKALGLPALGDYTKFKPALIARDGDRCVYCEARDKLVVDHMVPIDLGGTDAQDNLALACKPCNSGKAGRTPELARMTIRVETAAVALARYRDTKRLVTVTETPSESESDTDTESDTESKKEKRDVALAPPPPLDEAVAIYNSTAEQAGWPKVQRLTPPRKAALKNRLTECGGLDGWQTAMAKAAESRFLTGKTPRTNGHANWRPDFDWFVTASNFTKLMEGSYDNRTNDHQQPERGLGAALAALAD